MKRLKFVWILKTLVFVSLAVIAMGAVVMWLWNWLVPELFHGPAISFIQSVGILLLCKVLFKGFAGFKGGHHFYERQKEWKEKWEQMSPEERDKMRELWKKRCKGSMMNCTPPLTEDDKIEG